MGRRAQIVVMLLAGAGAAGLPAAGQFATSKPAKNPDAGAGRKTPAPLKSLVTRLGSPSVEQRMEAQENLENVSVWDRDQLAQLANASGDPEIEARAMIRLREMDDTLLLSSKPIPLRFRGGLSEAAAELAKRCGVPIWAPAADESGKPAEIYTLDGDDLAFCEVIARLSQEHPLALEAGPTRITLIPAGAALAPLVVSKGAVVSLGRVVMRSPPAKFPEKPMPVLQVPISVQIDPRVNFSSARDAGMKVISEDTGAVLIDSAGRPQEPYAGSNGGVTWTQSLPLPNRRSPEGLGIRGQIAISIDPGGSGQKEIDPAKQLHVPIAFAGAVITLAEFSMDPVQNGPPNPGAVLAFQTQGHDGKLPAPDIPKDFGFAGSDTGQTLAFPRYEIELTVIDAQSRKLHVSHLTSDSSGSERDHILGPFTAPLKVVLSSPTTLKTLMIPYEFKNVPVSP